jgi:PEP-CTERM motif
MRMLTKLTLGLAFPAMLIAGQSAFAAKITQWSYENEFGFTANTGTLVTGSNNNTNANFSLGGNPANPIVNNPTTLSWGVPQTLSGQSRLRLNNAADNLATPGKITGVETTDDGLLSEDLTVYHNNFVINLGAGLTSATIGGALLLEALVPANGTLLGPLEAAFLVKFKETNNAGEVGLGGACADGAAEPCPDVFVLDQSGPQAPLEFDLNGGVAIDGFIYHFRLDLGGVGPLGPESCAAAGVAAGCIGFITPENQISKVSVGFEITSRPETQVPEPGILALLGLGLAGLGFGQTRRRK